MDFIDVGFDFTSDTPRYWNNYWEKDSLLGCVNCDPDSASKTMQLYHKLLYSRSLPNGETMDLQIGSGVNYLTWKDFRFGSDSIIGSFRYSRYRGMIEQVANSLPDYHAYMENYIHKSYTIGGEIIFPKKQGGINQSRGCNPFIKDRWDLTLECIRKFYQNEESPLYNTLLQNKNFFDLFVDFKGYVDFFFLQDCVTDDYNSEYLLPFLKSLSHGEMFPYHNSSMMFIRATPLSDGFINNYRRQHLTEELEFAFALVAFVLIVSLQRHFDVFRLRVRVEPA